MRKTYAEKRYFDYREDEICGTIRAKSGSLGGGSECLIMTYQSVTGTISPGGHPGSYNGQDAYNDMLVTHENYYHKSQSLSHSRDNGRNGIGTVQYGLQGPADCNDLRGGGCNDMTSSVRRLTPLECTRLQGFPDGWVDIGDWTDAKGKAHKDADSPKYKALGNSIAMPFWEWLARRIAAQYERPVTMASLFDGIGGFPLAFQRAGGTAVWASEIEDFPIAVTKIHFPETEQAEK